MIKKNISYSLLANITRLLLGFIIFFYLSSIFRLNEFGIYIYIMSLSGFISILIDYGFNLSILNDVSKKPEMIMSYFYNILYNKIFLTIIVIIFFIIYISLTDYNFLLEFIIFALSAIIQSFAQFISSLYKAINKFDKDFYYALLNNILILLLVIIFSNNLNLFSVSIIYLSSKLIGLTYLLIILFRDMKSNNVKKSFNLNLIKSNFKFALTMIIGGFFLTIDIPIMKNILDVESLAIYGLGMKIFISLMIIADVVNGSFHPKLSKMFDTNFIEFKILFKKLIIFMTFIGLVISLCIYLTSEHIIKYFFEEKFYPLIDLIPLFTLALIIRYSTFSMGTYLTIIGLQKTRTYILLFVFLLHIVFNIIFQNKFGIEGAIYSLIVSFSLLALLNGFFIFRRQNVRTSL